MSWGSRHIRDHCVDVDEQSLIGRQVGQPLNRQAACIGLENDLMS